MVKELIVSWERFGDMSEKLADRLAEDYGKRIDIVVGLARGGILLSMVISERLNRELTFMRVKSYTAKHKEGKPRLVFDIQSDISKKTVLLVDDLSDTGETFKFSVNHLKKYKPKKIITASMHIKPWTKFVPDLYLEKTDRWVVYPWGKNREKKAREL